MAREGRGMGRKHADILADARHGPRKRARLVGRDPNRSTVRDASRDSVVTSKHLVTERGEAERGMSKNVKVKEHKNYPDSLTLSREIQKRTRIRRGGEIKRLYH